MFAPEDEQSDGDEISLGLGVLVALLASPGAFASISLMGKYSTLLQWIRGQTHFDFLRASVTDEYFFLVISMTIAGLVMLSRWNRLFPDRRDFSNLAPLPIPIHQVFTANLAALAGLALVFALDLNLISCFLFPAIVTSADPSAFFKVAFAHAVSVFGATLFSFLAMLALVGVLTLIVPAKWLRSVSLIVRIVLVVVLILEFFSHFFLQLVSARAPAHAALYMRWLPPYWFVGVYETLIGIATPVMQAMAHRAWLALALSAVVTLLSYALCYRRHFLRLAESFDTLAGQRHGVWFKMPDAFARRVFRSPFEEACILFALKVLTRSERHLMFLGAYCGIGLVLVAQSVSRDMTHVPLFVAFVLITGLRLVFDVPAALPSNWTFRFSANNLAPSPNAVSRRLVLFFVAPTQLVPLGSPYAIPLNLVFAVLAIDVLFHSFNHIPFTFRVQPDTRKMVIRFILALVGIVFVVPVLAALERWALASSFHYAFVAVALFLAWHDLRRRRGQNDRTLPPLEFDERAPSEFELLKLA